MNIHMTQKNQQIEDSGRSYKAEDVEERRMEQLFVLTPSLLERQDKTAKIVKPFFKALIITYFFSFIYSI